MQGDPHVCKPSFWQIGCDLLGTDVLHAADAE
jgi:hypothetical protein